MLRLFDNPAGILALVALIVVLRCRREDLPKIIRYIFPWAYREIRIVSEQRHPDARRPGLDGTPDHVVDGRVLGSGPEDGAAHGP